MADTIKTIGTAGDYADPILWAAGQGGISDGNREVGELISDVTMNVLFRPNQAFPDGGLLRGDTTVTGEIGVGRVLVNEAASRFCLAPSPNIEFCDLRISDGGVAKSRTFQSISGNVFTRVISMDAAGSGTIDVVIDTTGTTVNNSAVYSVYQNNSTVAGDVTINNCYIQERILCRQNNLLTIKNSISQAADWYLGRPGDAGAESLVNYCKILENANANEFGAGSSNNTVNVDSSAEFVNLAGGDFRIKSASPYSTAGDTGGVLGPFLEISSGTTGTITQNTQSFAQSSSGTATNSYTGTITQSTQSFSQSASGSVTSHSISGAISQSASSFTQSAVGESLAASEWALQFDGANDYLSFSTWGTAGDFLITGVIDTDSVDGDNYWFGSSISDRIYHNGNTLNFIINSALATINITTIKAKKVPFSFNRVGGTITYDIGVGTVTGSFVLTGGLSVNNIGSYGTSGKFDGRAYGQWVFDTLAGNKRVFDFDLSDHGAGTVTVTDNELVGDATGVNMPTDGSAWINITPSPITGDITQSINSFTQGATGTVIVNITGSITQTLNSFTQSISGTVKETITGTINQTVNSFVQSSTGAVAENITGNINQVISSFTMSAIGEVPATWIDKTKVTSNWGDKAKIATTWTDK